MQIFLPYVQPIQTARCLDRRRLNKQIIECQQIMNAATFGGGWANHPVTKMYANNLFFVQLYMYALKAYHDGNEQLAIKWSDCAMSVLPDFLKDAHWYFDNFKGRLYHKDNVYYAGFKQFDSNANFYWNPAEKSWVRYDSSR